MGKSKNLKETIKCFARPEENLGGGIMPVPPLLTWPFIKKEQILLKD